MSACLKLAVLLAVAALAACGSVEDEIKEEIEEYSGPEVSAEDCVEVGERDGQTVFECFGETYTKSPRLGCYSMGEADNLIEHECGRFREPREEIEEAAAAFVTESYDVSVRSVNCDAGPTGWDCQAMLADGGRVKCGTNAHVGHPEFSCIR